MGTKEGKYALVPTITNGGKSSRGEGQYVPITVSGGDYNDNIGRGGYIHIISTEAGGSVNHLPRTNNRKKILKSTQCG